MKIGFVCGTVTTLGSDRPVPSIISATPPNVVVTAHGPVGEWAMPQAPMRLVSVADAISNRSETRFVCEYCAGEEEQHATTNKLKRRMRHSAPSNNSKFVRILDPPWRG